MSESDLIYTETLMQRGKENYEGKEIVILGGGDGALLWELLKEKPKFVYMVEVGVFLMLFLAYLFCKDYGIICVTWYLTLRKEHILKVFENWVLRRISGPKREEVVRG
jgi:hypothetical protein